MPTPNPVSIVSYIQKVRSGIIFQEGFENPNFLTAEGWTTVQGSPVNTSNQYKQGIMSFQCTGTTAGTHSIISKSITDTAQGPFPGTETQDNSLFWANAWFYDDLTTTSSGGPYFKIKDSAGRYFQVGVRNNVSTSFYVCNATSSVAADNFGTIGATARTAGWHSFGILGFLAGFDPAGYSAGIYIDGVNQATVVGTSTVAYCSQMFVCSGTSADTTSAFGNFDSVGLYRSVYSAFGGGTSGVSLVAYDSNFSFVFNDSVSPNQFKVGFSGNYYDHVYPVSSTVQYAQYRTNGSIGFNNELNTFPGDAYIFQQINLGRKIEDPEPVPTSLENQNESESGVREVITYGIKDSVSFKIRELQGINWKQQIDNWFRYAVQGTQFSFVVDSTSSAAFGISTSSYQPGTSSIKIFGNTNGLALSDFSPTGGFIVGNYYVLQDQQNTIKQVVSLASKGTSSLAFNEPLNFSMTSGDYIYSLYSYPFCEIGGSQLNGLITLPHTSPPRYNWNQTFRDFNG